MNQEVIDFFAASDVMEHEVLRPLSHIRGNWELIVDQETGRYMDEEDSLAWLFNHLIDELAAANPPARYHDSEDRLGEHVQQSLNWNIGIVALLALVGILALGRATLRCQYRYGRLKKQAAF